MRPRLGFPKIAVPLLALVLALPVAGQRPLGAAAVLQYLRTGSW